MAKPSWNDMSKGQKIGIIALGAGQVALAALAWSDLAKRHPNQVTGPKKLWAAVIAVNWVGPIAYFVTGRRLDS